MSHDELIDYLWSLQSNQLGRIAIEGGLIERCDQLVAEGVLYEAFLQPKTLPSDRPRRYYQWSTEGHKYAAERNDYAT